MLSRIAESLYWVGRYVERAEDTARILDVHLQSLLEGNVTDERRASADLLDVMGVAVTDDEEGWASIVTDRLAFDPSTASSIIGSLTAARENARGVREAISSEMWECLNATFNALTEQHDLVQTRGLHGFFGYVKERAAIMEGLTGSTMSRDDGYRFLVLGRSLERVDMTARLLADRCRILPDLADLADFAAADSSDWTITLRSCSGHEAYLRKYRRGVEPLLVAEFLLLDRLFPRSIFNALTEAERCLAQLDPLDGRFGTPDEARRLLGRARTGLEFARMDELLVDLGARLDRLQTMSSAASDAIGEQYFRRTSATEWSNEIVNALTAVGGPAVPALDVAVLTGTPMPLGREPA